jgi:hypothetical protein
VWGDRFDEFAARLTSRIDRLMTQNGVHDKTLTVRVSDVEAEMRLKQEGEGTGRPLAWAIISDHAVIMRATDPYNGGNVMTAREPDSWKDGRPWHPTETVGTSTPLSTLDHEWGHVTDLVDREAKGRNIGDQNAMDADPNAVDDPNVQGITRSLTAVRTDSGDVEWWDYKALFDIGTTVDRTTSYYGTQSEYEMRAEAHSAWLASNGLTDYPMARFFFGTDEDRQAAVSRWFDAASGQTSGPLGEMRHKIRLLMNKYGLTENEARWRAFRERLGYYNRSVQHSSFYSNLVGLATAADFNLRWVGAPMPSASMTTIETNAPLSNLPETPGVAPAVPTGPEGVAP